MLCSRCVLSILTVYMLLEEISAAVIRSRNKREVNWLDQEVFSRLTHGSDLGDLSAGDAVETSRDHHSHSEVFIAPTEHLSVQRQRQSQFQYNRKVNEKRRKVAPLDSIGSFQMSSLRNRKDEPDIDREDYRN